jgi:hypothetical protein
MKYVSIARLLIDIADELDEMVLLREHDEDSVSINLKRSNGLRRIAREIVDDLEAERAAANPPSETTTIQE